MRRRHHCGAWSPVIPRRIPSSFFSWPRIQSLCPTCISTTAEHTGASMVPAVKRSITGRPANACRASKSATRDSGSVSSGQSYLGTTYGVATHPCTEKTILEALAQDPEPIIRLTVVARRDTSTQLLERLGRSDNHRAVRRASLARLTRNDRHIREQRYHLRIAPPSRVMQRFRRYASVYMASTLNDCRQNDRI